jgi:Flp pilus assembly protein TadD
MTRLTRSMVLASIATLTFAGTLGGCSSSGPQQATHKTMAATQYEKWNKARLAIMMQLATQQYEVGDYDKCRETLAQALALNVPSAPVYALGAKVELEKGSLELAENYLKTAVTVDPNNAECYYLLGVLYQRWENTEGLLQAGV